MTKKKGKKRDKFIEKVKENLLNLREEHSEKIESNLRELSSQEGHHLADTDELASDSTDDVIVSRILEMGSSRVKQIDKALEKIEKDTYGICEDCEDPINMARLEALPFADLCIDCKRKEEKEMGEDY